ncbi:hypothetical protein Hanom_Chr06g00518931 [Helianthus anomalus]
MGWVWHFFVKKFIYKVHGWSVWFTKFWIWSLTFQKYTYGPYGLHFVTHLVPSFSKKYMNGPRGLHFVTHFVPNLDMLKPLDLLAGDQTRYKVQLQTTRTIRVLLETKIQNFGKPQGPSIHFTLIYKMLMITKVILLQLESMFSRPDRTLNRSFYRSTGRAR